MVLSYEMAMVVVPALATAGASQCTVFISDKSPTTATLLSKTQ